MATTKQARDYILSVIDTDSLELPEDASEKEKITALYNSFMAGVGNWSIPQIGLQASITRWLQGLPGSLNHAFSDYEIYLKLKEWGDLNERSRESTIINKIGLYWNGILPYSLVQLFKRHGLLS